MLQAQSSFWTHAKNRAISPPPPSRQGRLFPPCRGIPVISLCVLRGSLLRRPVELRFVDPHAVQDNRKLARDGDLGLAEAVSLGELGSPCLQSRPFRYGSAARRLPRTNTCAAWRHRTSRFGRTNRFPRKHGVESSIRYRPRHFSIA